MYYEKEGNLIMEIINKLWKLLYSNLIYCSFNIVHDFQNKICDKNKIRKTIFNAFSKDSMCFCVRNDVRPSVYLNVNKIEASYEKVVYTDNFKCNDIL